MRFRCQHGSMLGPTWAHVGSKKPSWAVLEASRAVLEPSWAVLGPFRGPLGPSWGGLGGLLGRRGRCESRRGEYAKNVRFPKGMGRFLPLGALLGRLLGASWVVLTASWAFWRPSRVSWSDLSAFRGYLVPCGRPLGALLDRSGAILGSGKEFRHL